MKNVAVLTEDEAFALFFFPIRGIWQLKNPHPWEFAIQGKKMPEGGGGGLEGGRSWNWMMHKFNIRGVIVNYNA